MATQEDHETDTGEIASGVQSDIRHHSASTVDGPLPTDSMVTVRLSDSPVASILETSSHEHTEVKPLAHEHELPVSPRQDATLPEDSVPTADEDAVILEEDTNDISRESTASMASSVEHERSISTSGTIRSRSDSSGTLSSTGSAQVDWDELEKSEEQAPRDEGSDEVDPPYIRFMDLARANLAFSQPRSSSLDLNKRIMHWQRIQRQPWQERGLERELKDDHRQFSISKSLSMSQQNPRCGTPWFLTPHQ